MKKKLLSTFLFLIILSVFSISAVVALPDVDKTAQAQDSWGIRVCKLQKEEYTDLLSGDPMTQSIQLVFLIKGYANDTTYSYYESDVDLASGGSNIQDALGKVEPTAWKPMSDKNLEDVTVEAQDGTMVTYKRFLLSKVVDSYNKFVYFRKSFQYTDGGQTSTVNEFYGQRWNIIFNLGVSASDIGINRIDATYKDENYKVNNYVPGVWVRFDITFVVTTKLMDTRGTGFDPSNESLSYSLDKGNNWIPMTTNRVTLSQSYSGAVKFRATNINGGDGVQVDFNNVKLDMDAPTFLLSGTTKDADGDSISYTSEQWSCSDVVFSLSNPGGTNALSSRQYYVSVNNAPFQELDSTTFSVKSSFKSIVFKAVNEAGGEFRHNPVEVKIDKVLPNADVEVWTPNPVNETVNVKIYDKNSTSKVFANNSAFFRVFNRDALGAMKPNESALTYFYSVKGVNGDYGEYQKINAFDKFENSFVYATVGETIGAKVVQKTVSYRFYVKSEAGLSSEVKEVEIVLVNGKFIMEVQPIEYNKNDKLWASEKIAVYIILSSDTHEILGDNGAVTGLSTPTTTYTIEYAATNISPVEIHTCKAEFFKNVEKGKSMYRFYLDASADSTFIITAKNAAGKANAIPYVTEEKIMIDTTAPTVEMLAYIKPLEVNFNDYHYIQSGDWVNGRIIIRLKVKISISNIYVNRLVYDGSNWQEGIQLSQTEIDENRREATFVIEVGITDATQKKMSQTFGFRVSTGSGVRKDVFFDANIDLSNIKLDKVQVGSGDNVKEYTVDTTGNTITVDPISSATDFRLFSNYEQLGHFGYFANGSAFKDDLFTIEVNENKKGQIEITFYLYSLAVDYLGESVTSDKAIQYKIIIPYNTINIVIRYEASVEGGSDDTRWSKGGIDVNIKLVTNDKGIDMTGSDVTLGDEIQAQYTYYYMLINSSDMANPDYVGVWKKCNGAYDSATKLYSFQIAFPNSSFNGQVRLSVTNEAGFRSSNNGLIKRMFKIDNTTPDIGEIIFNSNDWIDKVTPPAGNVRHVYYSKDYIKIAPVLKENRSEITYYYFVYTAGAEVPNDPTQWTLLPMSGKTFEAEYDKGSIPTDYTVYLYAINALGEYSGGKDGVLYEFKIDPTVLKGNLSYNPADGGYMDEALGLYSYKWIDAKLNLSVEKSVSDVKYSFSLDNGVTWEDYYNAEGDLYHKAGVANTAQLIFNAINFPQGVMSAFLFKAENKAGSVYIFEEKIYIAIDTTVPDFELELTKPNGDEYLTSDTLTSDPVWSNVPIIINIKLNNVNVSGVRFTYTIMAQNSPATDELNTPSDTMFSSDKLVGFNKNNDALLTVYAYSKSTGLSTSVSKRLCIDQVTPEFRLNGQASSSDTGVSKSLQSGEWTNHTTVTISKAVVNANVSNVEYKVYYSDPTTTDQANNEYTMWPASGNLKYQQICTVRVVATTSAGLSYEQKFLVNIDNTAPKIQFVNGLDPKEGEHIYMDLRVMVKEENIKICEYITVKGHTRGFPLTPSGYTLSTSSVDNSIRKDPITLEEYRGYVHIYVEDYAGNVAELSFYVLPFRLTVNNITLTVEDDNALKKFQNDLSLAESYMEKERIAYFQNIIDRLYDRVDTVEKEIDDYRKYLVTIADKATFTLKDDYRQIFKYLETFDNYDLFGQKWIQDAITGDESSIYFKYMKNLKNVFDGLKVKMKEVEKVQDDAKHLPAINIVKGSDYNSVLRVYDAYSVLSYDQKSCFITTLYTKVLALKKKCEVLLLSDINTGVKLNGDVAPGARISVLMYGMDTEYYTNAQIALVSTMSATRPTAIVNIFRIKLEGSSSQTEVRNLTIELPIAEEYQVYKYFGVYKVSSDGTVTPISDITVQGDGKSVVFASDELATYVLAVKAAIEVNKGQDDTYGTLLGLDITVKMLQTIGIIVIVLFAVMMGIIIFAGLRSRRFLNSYNKAYRTSKYRRGVEKIPKGNTVPTQNPIKDEPERLKDKSKPYQ